MSRQFYRDALGWGVALWLIGYVLGIALFMFVPPAMIGWIILPIGTAFTLWVLFRWVTSEILSYYFLLAVIWTLIAVALDYLLIVRLLKPADGYYKLDVYIYYALTFALPLIVGWRKQLRSL